MTSFISVLICSLPDELMLKILDFLTPAALLSSARVCRRWLQLTNDKLVICSISESTSMVDSTKVSCPLFDDVEILILGDSPSIFTSLDKM